MDSSVEEIKSRLPIVEVVGQYVALQKAGRNYRGRCPFHKERTPSFMVSPERGTYMCFGCNEKGDIFSFVQKMEGVDFRAALAQLADRAGVQIVFRQSRETRDAKKGREEKLFEVLEAATNYFEQELEKREDVKEYIASRAVAEATARQWRIGFAPASWQALSDYLIAQNFSKDDIVAAGLAAKSEKKVEEVYDRFRGRIMFPIFDAGGKVIAFSGRFFEHVEGSREAREKEEPAKYVNSPETDVFKKSRTLYGLNFAKESMRKADCALLVEGQFDVVLAHQAGLRFALAVSGTALTDEHLNLVARFSKRLVLALDNDSAGLRSGLRSAEMALRAGFDVKIPELPEGCKDPADAVAKDPEILKKAVRESKPAIEFFLDVLKKSSKDERAYKKNVEAEILPLVAAIPSKIDQAHFVSKIASRLRVPEEAVRAEVAKLLQKKPRLNFSEPAINNSASIPDKEEPIDSFERNIAMLTFYFSPDSQTRARLSELVGAEKIVEIEERLRPRAEELRFRFEREVGEHTSEEIIATDVLKAIERVVSRERFKMKFL